MNRQIMSRMGGMLILVTVLSGCSSLEPWVKPYERAALADEVMSNDRNPSVTAYTGHIREVREAANGATGAAGGGCGCL